MIRSAEISPCGRFRYRLSRWWADGLFRGAWPDKRVTWIMLNPSTANAERDDPTIRRCISFSREWGYGGLSVVNLFAFRATYPRDLAIANFPVGDKNDEAILDVARSGALIVAAWGRLESQLAKLRAAQVRRFLQCPPHELTIEHLGTTKGGFPRHPLMVRGDVYPQRWDAA